MTWTPTTARIPRPLAEQLGALVRSVADHRLTVEP